MAGESKVISLMLTRAQFMLVDDTGVRRLEAGDFEIIIGDRLLEGTRMVVSVE